MLADVDLIVTFKAGAQVSLFNFVALKLELEGLLGCPVDLLERPLVESMKNPFKRRSILSCVKPIYACFWARAYRGTAKYQIKNG